MARPRIEIDQTFLDDPFAALRRAREAGPILDSEGGPGVFRYEDMRTLLADGRLRSNFPEFLRTFGVTGGPFYEWMAISPLNRDGAEHVKWRGLMSRTFTPRSVERLRPFLHDAAHELIDGFAARGSCEFMSEFADAYPSLGLCELIGVPREDRDRFRGWADTIGLGFSPLVANHIDEVDAALAQLLAYTGELAAARRVEPRDDLVTRIAEAAREDSWTDFEIQGFIAGLVFAGHETTKNQLGWMVAALSARPQLWDSIASGSTPAAEMVEEVLRYRPAVTGVGRLITEAVTVGSDRLEAGERVFLSAWSANHDERAYPHPEELDPAQSAETPHLTFGHGAHYCLGAALARAELQEALSALTRRIGCPTVGVDAAWRPPLGINGPERLPITFAVRAVAG
jgi:cytochrome P450